MRNTVQVFFFSVVTFDGRSSGFPNWDLPSFPDWDRPSGWTLVIFSLLIFWEGWLSKDRNFSEPNPKILRGWHF